MLASYAGMLIGMLNVLVLYPKFTSAEVFGLTRVFYEVSLIYYMLAHMGIKTISFRFFPRYKDHDNQHHGFLIFLLIYPAIGFLVFTAGFYFFQGHIVDLYSEKSPLLGEFIWLLPLMVLTMITFFALEDYTKLHNRSAVTSYVKEIGIRLLNILGIILFALGVLDVMTFLVYLCFVYGAATLVLVFYLNHMGWLYLRFPRTILRYKIVREMLIYGGITILGNMSATIAVKLDIMMLPALSGLDVVSYYFIAVTIGKLLTMPMQALRYSVLPTLTDAINANDTDKIRTLNVKAASNLLIFSCLLGLLIVVNVDAFYSLGMKIWKDPGYLTGLTSVFVLVFARTFLNATGLCNDILMYSKYYLYQVGGMVVLLVLNFGLNLILIPKYGITGAAIASGTALIVSASLRVILIYLFYRIVAYSWNMLWMLLVGVAVLVPVYLIPLPIETVIEAFISLVVKTVLGGGLYLFVAYKLRLSPEANKLGDDLLRRALQTIGRG